MKRKSNRRTFLQQSTTALLVTSGYGVPVAAGSASTGKRQGKASGLLSATFLAGLPRLMELANVPGIAIATIADGKLSWASGFGVKKAGASDATGNSVDADTVFGAASLSKPVFAYAVFKLRDDKLIDLDRPLASYLAADDLPDDPRSKQITARHVLSHTSGWQNWRVNKDQKLTFGFNPGERFSYSGEGYYMLQRVVEKVTDRGFEEFIRERLLKPLGMTRSTYVWSAEIEPQVASGHNGRAQAQEIWNARQGRKLLEVATKQNKPLPTWRHEDTVRAIAEVDTTIPTLPNFMIPNCAGSLLTTANDYARFLVRIMDGAPGADFAISERSRREMLTPQVKLNSALSWGLGWGLQQEQGSTWFWHWGDNGVFKTFAMGDPVQRTGVVVFTNGSNGHKLWQRIVAQATGRDHAAFLWFMT